MRGLHETVIEPSFGQLLPDLVGKRVVDLGCGDGWLCRRARAQEAVSGLGIEPSAWMLKRAREHCHDPKISFLRSAAA